MQQTHEAIEYRGVNNHQHLIDQTYGAVHLVRKKGTNHGFLLLEEVTTLENGLVDYQISRADLFVESSSLYSSNSSGTAFIKFDTISPEKYETEIKSVQVTARSWTLSYHAIERLKAKIREDQEKATRGELHYNLAGDSALYSSFFKRGDHANCISWCLDVLKDLGDQLEREDLQTLSLQGTWTQFFFLSPEKVIPDQGQHQTNEGGCTLL